MPLIEQPDAIDLLHGKDILRKETKIKKLEGKFCKNNSVDLAKIIIKELNEYLVMPPGNYFALEEEAREKISKYEKYISENQ